MRLSPAARERIAAAVLRYREGVAPLSRPMLIVTDKRQAAYIATVGFEDALDP